MNRPTQVMAVLLGLVLFSCSSFKNMTAPQQNLVMTGSQKYPAAQGNAKVSTTDDGNTQINLDVKHLAFPDRINNNATVFVVWAQNNREENATPQNLGALKVDSDEHGTLTALTPLRSFNLYVTAESSPTSDEPRGDQLLHTNVEMPAAK